MTCSVKSPTSRGSWGESGNALALPGQLAGAPRATPVGFPRERAGTFEGKL